jgi:molybdenum cofactor synthesis domain-containing protein
MKASILAIGTELTTGQIINKNAATLSEKLKKFGVTTVVHLTVPDDRQRILDSLIYLESQSDLFFITGGLGPTSDDFTRELVAEWAQKKLKYDEGSWQHIVERLSTRGFPVRDIQKQQCYFPEGSQILTNSEGTANGFHLKLQKNSEFKNIFVLPGPPREIDAIWNSHITTWLNTNTQNLDLIITKSWDTLGVGESDVALTVEDLLKNRPSDLYCEIGYRVHLPYVEVKFSFLKSQQTVWEKWIQQLDQGLQNITITRDFEDVALKVIEKIKTSDFTFYDFVTNGYLHNRLSPFLKKCPRWSFKQAKQNDLTADFFENETQFMALLPLSEEQCLVIFNIEDHLQQRQIEAPMKSPLMSERRKQYFAEMSLVELLK